MRRLLLGISGVPGAGKSTFAARLATELDAVVIPMDGFHLPDSVLAARGLTDVKGAPETFDREGFEALLERLRDHSTTVMAPAYSRELHAVVPDAIEVQPHVETIIVEGNYLGIWREVRDALDEIWRLDVPWEVARERLIARRVASGRDDAEAWVDRVDAANARLVADSYATRILTA